MSPFQFKLAQNSENIKFFVPYKVSVSLAQDGRFATASIEETNDPEKAAYAYSDEKSTIGLILKSRGGRDGHYSIYFSNRRYIEFAFGQPVIALAI